MSDNNINPFVKRTAASMLPKIDTSKIIKKPGSI